MLIPSRLRLAPCCPSGGQITLTLDPQDDVDRCDLSTVIDSCAVRGEWDVVLFNVSSPSGAGKERRRRDHVVE